MKRKESGQHRSKLSEGFEQTLKQVLVQVFRKHEILEDFHTTRRFRSKEGV